MICKYDNKAKATSTCAICGDGLCDICGYVDDTGLKYCNECWHEITYQMNEDRIGDAKDMLNEHEENYFNNQELLDK